VKARNMRGFSRQRNRNSPGTSGTGIAPLPADSNP